jgi:DNA repair protein RadD
MITPRYYQVDAVSAFYNYFQNNAGNPIIAMPTGTGKAVVQAMLLQSILYQYPGQRIISATHVKELVDQNHKKLKELWPHAPAGVYSAGLNKKEHRFPISFVGIGSVAKKAHLFGHVDLLFIDEAHLVSPDAETLYRKFIEDLRIANPNLKVVGLTATPWRLGQGKITQDGIFTDVCYDITNLEAFNRLISEGFLATLIPKKTTSVLDTDGVHMRGGEFIASELQHAVDKAEITHAAIKEAMELASDRHHWLVFASGVEHAINIAAMMNDMGIPTVAIHSKMPDAARDQAIIDFKCGKYRAAVNNNVLTTGFDFPAIDCIVVLRPTASTVLWVQMLGRGTRPSPGKENCLVLDFAGNTRRLGPINDPVIPRKKGEKGGGEAPVKLCENCQCYNHASARHCEFCGTEFVFKVKIKVTAASEELVKGEVPVVATFVVDHVTYSRHSKEGRPPMVRVSYFCGLRKFSEYVCIEHDGFAQRKARQWWKERTDIPFPMSTDEALILSASLKPSTHLRVWINKTYPEILLHCFDGTSFGENPVPLTPAPTVTPAVNHTNFEDLDDDIPF